MDHSYEVTGCYFVPLNHPEPYTVGIRALEELQEHARPVSHAVINLESTQTVDGMIITWSFRESVQHILHMHGTVMQELSLTCWTCHWRYEFVEVDPTIDTILFYVDLHDRYVKKEGNAS